MKVEYGIPYMGSKAGICNELVKRFPSADNFYDLFGGGFSVTHAMITRRSKDYKAFHFNEIRPGICDLIQKAIDGGFNYNNFLPKWVSREEFSAQKDQDPMVKMLWSFGNNGKDYLFSKEIEPYKKSMHNAVVFNELDDLAKLVFGFDKFKSGFTVKDRRLFLRNKIEWYRKTKVPEFLHQFLSKEQLVKIKNLDQLKMLQQLQRLERLERLEQLERLEFYNTSYENVNIKPNSVIYCDPPYENTASYDGSFDKLKFLDWCHEQKNPVFISEYEINDPRFSVIFQIKKRSLLSSNKTLNNKTEKVYINQYGRQMLIKLNLGRSS